VSRDREIFKDLSILCVEDEEWVRESLVDFLKRRFKNVYSAENGQIGLEIFQEKHPDIVMTDIQMPKKNGLDMSREIKEIDSEVPIAIVSAFNDIEYLLEAINIGIESYVNKPVDSKKLHSNLYRCAIRAKFKDAQKKLSESEELFRTVAEDSPSGICIIKDSFLYVNKAIEEITGFSKEEMYQKTPFENIVFDNKDDEESFKDNLRRRLEGERFISRFPEAKIVTKNGNIKYLDIISNTITYKGESVSISNCSDITDRKWFEDELEQKRVELEKLNSKLKQNIVTIEEKNRELHSQLYNDKLTGLPNRVKLLKDIDEAREDAIVVLLNIDSFKEINDFYGNKIGDQILGEIASIINEHIQNNSKIFTLYRLQADEYAIFSAKDLEHKALKDFIQNLHDFIERHLFMAKGQEIHLNVTVGIARGSKENIINRADMALKRAKKLRKQFLFYDKSMMVVKEYEQNLKWLKILKNALEDKRVVAFFQPIMDNKTKKINKFECLARLISEEGNVYAPFFFLDISKRSRLYEHITRSIIDDAIENFLDTEYLFSVNISIEDILDEKTIGFIKERFEGQEIANRVVFEILESEHIKNYESISDFIAMVKSYGCKIAIDDFGSGYSNFAHIINLDIDFIKIDSSIIKNSDKDRNSQIISKTIVDFSKRLNIKTIAEFVHSKEVLDAVSHFGVDFSQGYFIGEPKRDIDITVNID
jgi:diguanylate cyclase (GGDEF)-like protein/PAS domain S-box-containing protein